MIAIGVTLAKVRSVQRLLAILSCLLFVGQAFAVQSLPDCTAQSAGACAHCCCGMKCCAVKPASQTPVVPARTISQNQFLILALSTLTLSPVSGEPASQNFSSASQPLSVSAVPIFQRDCAILI